MTYKLINISMKQGFPVINWEVQEAQEIRLELGFQQSIISIISPSLRPCTWGAFILPQSSFNQLETVGHELGWLNYWNNHQPNLENRDFYIFFNDFNGIRGKLSMDSHIHAEKSGHTRVWDLKHCFLWTFIQVCGNGCPRPKRQSWITWGWKMML